MQTIARLVQNAADADAEEDDDDEVDVPIKPRQSKRDGKTAVAVSTCPYLAYLQ